MSVLSATTQKQVEASLVKGDLVKPTVLQRLKKKADQEHTALLSLLVQDGHISNEALTKTIAHVTKVPYVNLLNANISPEILGLLSREVAERHMAVPLGEMQHR